ncbi:MAG: hypothetical protein HQ569_00625 [Actinobacteria bacterium]|nr:hypothetical protein [Actinomycetota bacterium]
MITLKKLSAIKIEKAIKIREEDLGKFLGSLGRKDTSDKNEIWETMEYRQKIKMKLKKNLRIKKCI